MPELILNNLNYIIWPLVVLGIAAYCLVKRNNNRKAAESGEDLNRLRQKVASLFTDAGDLSVVYAHYEQTEHYGRTTKTTYYRYAVAFRGEALWVFPLGVDKKTREYQVAKPMTLGPDNLGRVAVTTSEKNGAVKSVDAHLYNKDGKSIIQFTVDAKNLRTSRYYPVNILQQEGCDAFYCFITPLAQQVSSENTALEAKMEQDAKEANGTLALTISIVGAVIGFFFAPVGLVISAVGLAIAVRGRMQGARKNTGLIVSGVITVVLAVWSWFFITQIMMS